jgi:hypothetical protein
MGYRLAAAGVLLAIFATRCSGMDRTIVLDARSTGPAVTADAYGGSLVTWWDFREPFVNPSLREAGIGLVRWPGGSESDTYHWENGGSLCNPSAGYIMPGATFDNLMSMVAKPLGLDVAVTLNYGSNRACNGGGEPAEAAAWVAYAKSHGYRVAYWTVGNENYGSWEYDLHPQPHDPHTYAREVRTGFYPAVKGADPDAKLGIVVDTPDNHAWNDVVLREAAPFDFVELHYYPQHNVNDDRFLLGHGVDDFARILVELRAEMTAAGVASSVPIYLGEYNNDSGEVGKQSVSIVNGLFLGQMLGTLLNAGVPMATWWLAYGSCGERGDYSSHLYGWQSFGSRALFSDGLPNASAGCPNAPRIAGGTPFPTGRVMALFAREVPPGSSVRGVFVPGRFGSSVRAYGFAESNGYALVLFNNTLHSVDVVARVRGAGGAFTASVAVYGKEQYDRSRENRWVGAVARNLGRVGASVPLALAPYSMTVLRLR